VRRTSGWVQDGNTVEASATYGGRTWGLRVRKRTSGLLQGFLLDDRGVAVSRDLLADARFYDDEESYAEAALLLRAASAAHQVTLNEGFLRVGDIISTSYGTGPYEIERIKWGCICSRFDDEINAEGGVLPPPTPPHMHLVCTRVRDGGRGDYHLGGYDARTLRSVWNDRDYLIKEA